MLTSLVVTACSCACEMLSKCEGGPRREPEKGRAQWVAETKGWGSKGLAASHRRRVSQAGGGAGRERIAGGWEVACCQPSQGWGPGHTSTFIFLSRSNRLGLALAWGFRLGRERSVLRFQILALHPRLTQCD